MAKGLVLSKAVADPSSGEILRVEQRGDAPLPSPSLKQPTGECWKIVEQDYERVCYQKTRISVEINEVRCCVSPAHG